jgi:chemosensory pili system protein ChpA (sensor histidine kinase/response regulator)
MSMPFRCRRLKVSSAPVPTNWRPITAPDAPPFEYANITYKLHYLGEFVHGTRTPSLFGQTMPLPIMLVRGGDQRVAIQVDQLIGSREIVVKSVERNWPALPVFPAPRFWVTVPSSSFWMCWPCCVRHRGHFPSARPWKPSKVEAKVEKAVRTVMVVDDSVTVRKVTSRLLERHGYEVVLAKDGLDAITKLEDIASGHHAARYRNAPDGRFRSGFPGSPQSESGGLADHHDHLANR